jgi:hypothetical protein
VNNKGEIMWKEVVVAYLRDCPGIGLEGMMKTAKDLNHNSRSPYRDLNPGPPELKSVVLK